MVLVGLRHQVERDMIRLAARLAAGGAEISTEEYEKNLRTERDLLRERDGWKRMSIRLDVQSCKENKLLEVLRLLSNSYKHDPFVKPEPKLLRLLNLPSQWPKERATATGAPPNGSQLPRSPKKRSTHPWRKAVHCKRRLQSSLALGVMRIIAT